MIQRNGVERSEWRGQIELVLLSLHRVMSFYILTKCWIFHDTEDSDGRDSKIMNLEWSDEWWLLPSSLTSTCHSIHELTWLSRCFSFAVMTVLFISHSLSLHSLSLLIVYLFSCNVGSHLVARRGMTATNRQRPNPIHLSVKSLPIHLVPKHYRGEWMHESERSDPSLSFSPLAVISLHSPNLSLPYHPFLPYLSLSSFVIFARNRKGWEKRWRGKGGKKGHFHHLVFLFTIHLSVSDGTCWWRKGDRETRGSGFMMYLPSFISSFKYK